MDGRRTDVRYTPSPDDPSWSGDWAPATPKGVPIGWDQLGEDDFLYERFRVDVSLEVGGLFFSRRYLPVVDFALAWASAPIVLKEKPRIDMHSSVEAITYKAAREGATVTVTTNDHEGEGRIAWTELEDLVDTMIERAFTILYGHHPELRTNPYLLDLRERLAELGLR
ncbi:hypothetical protein GCM10009830_08850 [Glycomyces endophyticus]|uniref:Uncharacterized protein n=1 Tax=Glycomyces endophyticus TaxID=480996 RepID=A0ABN2G556_9ACTN